ncbi:putative WRKY transcription factor 29 [Curcuma longa]|uniref:putative WRKY transcription factor 29 n=1 Tax=Curcuma longa TaxID=136217 RepID=UPI003D9F23DB
MWSSSPWVAAEEEWDIGAVVRGRRPSSIRLDAWFPSPATLDVAEEEEAGKTGSFSGFPDLLQRRDGFQELEELYKPFFFSKSQQMPLQLRGSPPASWLSPADPSIAVVGSPQPPPPSRQAHRLPPQIPRSKRRKNQQKKVVCQVPADGLSTDVWAWRKYGQKPIKGSPYPRGYYRCSSSKSCLARKQVERSRVDPATFIVTYTAEHNHPVCTHRSSLAGSTRHKFPAPASAVADDSTEPSSANHSSNPPSVGLSPTTPLTASTEDETLRRRSEDGDEADDDEEEDEMLLDVEGMDVDDLQLVGGAASPDAEALCDDESALGDHRFQPAWIPHSSSTATAASGS